MTVVNDSAYPDDEVYLALTGRTMSGYEAWSAHPSDLINTSVPLSCLPEDPSDPSGHTHRFWLGQGIGSGLLWISLGAPVTSGLPTVQPSFDTTDYRFANVEFAYPGQGDMTNVDQFSFPVDLRTTDTGGNSVSSTYGADTCTIVQSLHRSVDDYNRTYVDSGLLPERYRAWWGQIVVTDQQGGFVRVVAPKQRARQLDVNGQTPNPYAQGWPSMLPYVESLAGRTITVKGLFTPGTSSPYDGQTGWYRYEGTFAANGDLSLTGTIGASLPSGPGGTGSFPGAAMSVEARTTMRDGAGNPIGVDGLAPGIYDQNSQYTVGGQPRNGWTDGVPDPAAPNDVYNSIYRDLVSAFTYGYWGGRYGNDNEDYWMTFAPPLAPTGGQPGFATARETGVDADRFLGFSIYSDVMFRFSDHYNIPYGENYGSGAPDRPSPLLEVPVGGEWQMTIRPDGPDDCLGDPATDVSRPDLALGPAGEAMVGDGIYLPSPQLTPQVALHPGGAQTFRIRIENDASSAEAFVVEAGRDAEPRAPSRRRRIRVTYVDAGDVDITGAVTNGTYTTGTLAPGEDVVIRARVVAGPRAVLGTERSWTVTVRSPATLTADAGTFRIRIE